MAQGLVTAQSSIYSIVPAIHYLSKFMKILSMFYFYKYISFNMDKCKGNTCYK